MNYFPTGLGRILGEEGRVAHEHLVEDDSDRPPVDGFVVALSLEDFRSNVIWCSDCAVRELPVPLEQRFIGWRQTLGALVPVQLVENRIGF